MKHPSERFNFALVRTFDSGNIGSAFRALLNMGFHHLWVIDPIHFNTDLIEKMAAGTKKELKHLKTAGSLHDFAQQMEMIYAFSARPRKDYPHISLNELLSEVNQSTARHIGFLFGNETNGLNNDELYFASKTVFIPTGHKHSSLNLAQAVLLAAYTLSGSEAFTSGPPLATSGDKELLFSSVYELIASHLFQKEITAKKNKILLHNAFQKWPLSKKEFAYLHHVFQALLKKAPVDKPF